MEGEAILIEPVLEQVDRDLAAISPYHPTISLESPVNLEQVDRDLAAISALGLTLTLVLNTHCHADHITGSGALKRRLPALQSIISKASGARADRHVSDGEVVQWAAGRRRLKVLATPGHTSGCISFYDESIG